MHGEYIFFPRRPPNHEIITSATSALFWFEATFAIPALLVGPAYLKGEVQFGVISQVGWGRVNLMANIVFKCLLRPIKSTIQSESITDLYHSSSLFISLLNHLCCVDVFSCKRRAWPSTSSWVLWRWSWTNWNPWRMWPYASDVPWRWDLRIDSFSRMGRAQGIKGFFVTNDFCWWSLIIENN